MKKSDTFADRRQEAEAAKNRRVEKFKAKPDQASHEGGAKGAVRVQGHGWGEEGGSSTDSGLQADMLTGYTGGYCSGGLSV